jgi:hypothetical protein
MKRAVLEREAAVITRYLLGTESAPQWVERYCAANEVLFPEEPGSADRAALDLVRRHPWSLPFLEAAHAWIRPGSRLRRKVLVMLAILETTPELARRFEPRAGGPIVAMFRLAGHGLAGGLRILFGLLLSALFVRTRGDGSIDRD